MLLKSSANNLQPPAPAQFPCSHLPYACVCAAGGGTVARLEHTRLHGGSGMGLLVCGKATVSAEECDFEGMGAAGKRDGTVNLFRGRGI